MTEIRRTPNYDSRGSMRIQLLDNGIDVARLSAPTFDMRIGSAIVKTGGIAGVGTDEERRGQGHARIILNDSTRYFTETGHDMALLFGIPDFYHKFGYAPVLPGVLFRIPIHNLNETELPQRTGNYSVRPMEPDDFAAVLDIYDAQNGRRNGCFVRSREGWSGFRRGTQWGYPPQGMTVLSDAGQVIGYYVIDGVHGECRISEVGFAEYTHFRFVLAAIAEEANRKAASEVRAILPPDHPFAVLCRGTSGGTTEVTYHRCKDGMARIINVHSLFTNLAGELTQRLANSSLAGTSGALRIKTDIGAVGLLLEGGQVGVGHTDKDDWQLQVPQRYLAQLVMGYRGIDEVAMEDGVHFDAGARTLLDTLFPTRMPWLPTPDWF
jgi:predicted acetyltransferase